MSILKLPSQQHRMFLYFKRENVFVHTHKYMKGFRSLDATSLFFYRFDIGFLDTDIGIQRSITAGRTQDGCDTETFHVLDTFR